MDRDIYHVSSEIAPLDLLEINCLDEQGVNQGWWIHHPASKNDSLIDWFTIGKYQDGIKIGTWSTIENVHQIYTRRTTEYIRTSDSTGISVSEPNGTFSIIYSVDSSFVQATRTIAEINYPLKTECALTNSKNECTMTYRGEELSTFSSEYLKSTLYSAFEQHSRIVRRIDEKYR
ncbi:MAG: hypothetical protein OCD76_06770 [Reichenbachiella sp.]